MANWWDAYPVAQQGIPLTGGDPKLQPTVRGLQLGIQKDEGTLQANISKSGSEATTAAATARYAERMAAQQLREATNKADYMATQARNARNRPSALSPQDSQFLNDLRTQSQSGLDSLQQYRNAGRYIDRLGTGPYRAMVLDAAIPQEGGGFFDKLGAATVGTASNLFGGISPQTVSDFQNLKGIQSQRVLQAQIAQKGPQTESDAARMKLTEIGPYNTVAANREIIRNGAIMAALAAKKAPFYTKWAETYGGVNAPDKQGRTVDDVWAGVVAGAQARSNARVKGAASPTLPKGGPVRIKGDDDYAKLPSGTAFVAPDGSHRVKP